MIAKGKFLISDPENIYLGALFFIPDFKLSIGIWLASLEFRTTAVDQITLLTDPAGPFS